MRYDLVQYVCDECGKLSPVMDCDERLPKGWMVREDRHNGHYCPECAKRHSNDIQR